MTTKNNKKIPFYPELKPKKRQDSGLLVSNGGFDYEDCFDGGIILDIRKIVR